MAIGCPSYSGGDAEMAGSHDLVCSMAQTVQSAVPAAVITNSMVFWVIMLRGSDRSDVSVQYTASIFRVKVELDACFCLVYY
jgi:hypothetical protein